METTTTETLSGLGPWFFYLLLAFGVCGITSSFVRRAHITSPALITVMLLLSALQFFILYGAIVTILLWLGSTYQVAFFLGASIAVIFSVDMLQKYGLVSSGRSKV
jgi:hypothetical protein